MKPIILLFAMWGVALLLSLSPSRFDSSQASAPEDSLPREIASILHDQQVAWNRGEVDSFMQGYWNSSELTFAGSSGVTRGWQAVLDRYRKNYPDPQTMGQLEFSEVEVHPLGKEAAFVLGRWHLKRASGGLGGIFTLIFRQFPEGWRIVHDHTSLDAKGP
jgi:ketosteroid isomerase-like protein